jgi:branched-chain amino acid transport system permease protein
MLDTPAKRRALIALVVVALTGVWWLPDQMLLELATAFALGIGAIGLNVVTGYAGQVSLGHSFFMGLGAFTAAIIGGAASRPDLYALEIGELLVWLPAAGLVAAIAGALVAPLALRLRGLYLAIVTLGLVFIGQYVFNQWAAVSGGEGVGRPAAKARILGLDFSTSGEILGVQLSANQRMFALLLVLLVIAAVVAKNIVRSDVGRAFQAVRDRDQAAEVIGVDLTRTKVLAFTISSFYGGVSGALLYAIVGVVDPASFGLTLAVLLLAMVLIGGAGTIAGGIIGALFITFLGTVSAALIERAHFLTDALSLDPSLLEAVLGGLILILFLLFEPSGLFGMWQRARTYWKGWPFTY